MMSDEHVVVQTLHQAALAAGFTELIPVIPPDAPLHDFSRVDPASRGKVPGDYFGGAWDGLGSWATYQMTPLLAVRWDSLGANVGQKMGVHWVGLDMDVTDDTLAQAMRHELAPHQYPVRIGQAPKAMWIFRVQGDPIRSVQHPLRMEGVEGRQLVEVKGVSSKGTPSQAVIFGTHPTGVPYTWDRPVTAADIPYCTQAQMDGLVERLLTVADGRGWHRGKATRQGSADGTSALGATAYDTTLVPSVVALINNDDLEYDDWIRVGYGIKGAMGAPGWETWATWSGKAGKQDPKMTKRTWDTLEPDGSTGMGTLVHLAREDCGGFLPAELAERVRQGTIHRGAEVAGMPERGGIPMAPPETHDREWIVYTEDDKGNPVQNMANVHAYLHNQDMWSDCFAFNAFANRAIITKPIPGGTDKTVGRWLADGDYDDVRIWLQRYVFAKIGKTDVIDAVEKRSRDNNYEPVQQYLNRLTWDGTPRIDNWLFTYAGVRTDDMNPTEVMYVGQVARKWLISAVARAMRPGCQVDHALIMEGAQGQGKSSILRALCPDPDWFSDSLPEFHSKDAAEHLDGKWIIEMAELTSVFRSQVEDMRRFLTRTVEMFRPSYGRKEVNRPRRCVFSGTTNRDDYLKDSAGERRFWIVRTLGKLLVAEMKRDRNQLWAEAVVAFNAGEDWWLNAEMEAVARQVQQERVPHDPWVDDLRPFLDSHPELCDVSIKQCMVHLGINSPGQRDFKSEKRVSDSLMVLGYRKNGKFTDKMRKNQVKWSR